MTITIGVEIGQKRDPTAVCVAEVDRRDGASGTETHFIVRYLQRLPLGTPYPKVAERIARITGGVQARKRTHTIVYVAATGVGQPVVDLLREQIRGARVVEVYFTHGDRRTEAREAGQLRVSLGKAYLVSRLQALL
jgi:hypothetical protein